MERARGTVAGLLEPGLELRCDQHGLQSSAAARDAAVAVAHLRLPRARRCRLRRTCCGACDAPLLLPVRRTQRSLTVDGDGLPVHTIHLDLPLTRCPDCGVDQVPLRSQDDLDGLLDALYGPGAVGGHPG
ncbi:MAG: hypothetical protein ACNA8R_13520 [Nitriliruptoraceae bacterium]